MYFACSKLYHVMHIRRLRSVLTEVCVSLCIPCTTLACVAGLGEMVVVRLRSKEQEQMSAQPKGASLNPKWKTNSFFQLCKRQWLVLSVWFISNSALFMSSCCLFFFPSSQHSFILFLYQPLIHSDFADRAIFLVVLQTSSYSTQVSMMMMIMMM